MQTSSIRERNRGTCFKHSRTCQAVNKKGRRKFIALSTNPKNCLKKKKVGRLFFRRLRANHPQLKTKYKTRVYINHGLQCTHEMAIEHLNELDWNSSRPEENWNRSLEWKDRHCPNLGSWWDTPVHQLQKKWIVQKKVFAGSGEDCDELKKENHKCVTIQPFRIFKGNQVLCRVIFSGSGHNSHMCPKSAAEKISNLLISVNDSGCTDHTTLHAAYKELEKSY